MSARFPPWLWPAFAFVIVTCVYLYRLDQPLLWGDEADTGIEARAVLQHGYPLAFDGRNVSIYDDGSQLNRHLVCVKVPWDQYYVGALSLLLFGDTTGGLRVLFALCGALSFFPIYAVLRHRLRFPAFMTALALLAPQIVLLQRNARYYPLLTLIYALLIWHLSRDFKSSRTRFLLASVIFILFFHTHAFAALCSALALVFYCVLFRRDYALSYFCASAIGFASWFTLTFLFGPSLNEPILPIFSMLSLFGAWLRAFGIGLAAEITDLDAIDCLPLLLWALLLTFLFFRDRLAWRNLFRDKIYAVVLLNIFIQAVAAAAVFGFESVEKHSFVRYQAHLLVFSLVALFLLLNATLRPKSLYVIVAVVAVACNFATLSFWSSPFSRTVSASWLLPVYAEIFHPPENAWNQTIARLQLESQHAPNPDSVMISLPTWTSDVAIFYLGHDFIIQPFLQDPTLKGEHALRSNLGEQAFTRICAKPRWIVDFLGGLQKVPPGYVQALVIPSHQKRPDDGSRPELTRHSLTQSEIVGHVRLFRLQDDTTEPLHEARPSTPTTFPQPH